MSFVFFWQFKSVAVIKITLISVFVALILIFSKFWYSN